MFPFFNTIPAMSKTHTPSPGEGRDLSPFLIGFLGVLSFAYLFRVLKRPAQREYVMPADGPAQDRDALRGDFRQVGEDMRNAARKVGNASAVEER